MRVEQFDVGEVLVLPHALSRAKERWGLVGSDTEILAQIESNVRSWVENGLVFDRKPRQYRPFGDDGFIPSWQRLVGTEDIACIVALDHVGKTTVVTALSRTSKIKGIPPRGRNPRA